jgi:NhaA family Na+:H+ antiporter
VSHRRRHSPDWEAIFRSTIEYYLLLPIGALIALVWANTAGESYFGLAHAIAFPVNEIGMALFFAFIAQEIVESTLNGGALHTWRRWLLPVAGAIGAVAASSLVYLLYIEWSYQEVLRRGWPIASATDIAFTYFLVKAIFGRRHPAVAFMLVLAIAVDVVGLLAASPQWAWVDVRPGGVALMIAALGSAFLLNRLNVRTFWPYLLISGPLSWAALYLDGLHPALALIPIVPFLPHARRRLDFFGESPQGVHDSPRHFEHVWRYPIHAVLFLFALANAGVLLRGYGTGTWGLLWAALAAKPVGVLVAVGLAVLFGLRLPLRLHWRDLVVVSIGASAGFTWALFFATSVYPPGPILMEVKMGALGTVAAIPLALAAAWLLGLGRFAHRVSEPHVPSPAGQIIF